MTLEIAVQAGDAAGALELLRTGADVNARGKDGMTPLMLASGIGAFHLAQLLLTAGADVLAIEPRMGATALHKAAQAGNPDLIDLLIDHGAFVDQQSPVLGNTPLMDAVLHKQDAAVARLLRRGARTPIVNHWHQSALDIARASGLDAIARRIEEKDRATADAISALTLFNAARRGDVADVKRLLAEGCSVDEQVPMVGSLDDLYTPLGVAAREGHVEVARVLLEAGADACRLIGLMGGMALHDAAYFGHADIVRLLVKHAARSGAAMPGLNVQGAYNGLSALHDAVWQGRREVVQALVDAGARLDLRTHTGHTPRGLAHVYDYPEIAALLERAEQQRPLADETERSTG